MSPSRQPGGTSVLNSGDHYTYGPAITGVSPATGGTNGATSVTITGTDFTGATAVSFGSTPALSYTVNSATSVTAVSPAASAGAVNITVTTPDGTSPVVSADTFTYPASAPTVTAVSPSNGAAAGGTSVTITRLGLQRGHCGEVRGRRRHQLRRGLELVHHRHLRPPARPVARSTSR